MRYVDIHKKRPSRLAWPIGVIVLGLAAWGITVLLRPDPQPEPPVVATTAIDSNPPSLIPLASDQIPGGIIGFVAIAPLDEEDIGKTVDASGEVVAPADGGFWLKVGNEVFRVESARSAGTGDSVRVSGTIRVGGEDGGAPDALGRNSAADDLNMVRGVVLVEPRPAAPDSARGGG